MQKLFEGLLSIFVLISARDCVSNVPTAEELLREQETEARRVLEPATGEMDERNPAGREVRYAGIPLDTECFLVWHRHLASENAGWNPVPHPS